MKKKRPEEPENVFFSESGAPKYVVALFSLTLVNQSLHGTFQKMHTNINTV